MNEDSGHEACCARCRYFGPRADASSLGACRRHPPLTLGHLAGGYPAVSAGDSCSDFQPRDDASARG